MSSHISTRIKVSMPPSTFGEGNSSEWPVDGVPSAQKAFEMGEESVKLGVTWSHAV